MDEENTAKYYSDIFLKNSESLEQNWRTQC